MLNSSGVAIRVTEEEGGTTTTSTMIATMLAAEVDEALATGSGLEEAQFTIGLDHARFDTQKITNQVTVRLGQLRDGQAQRRGYIKTRSWKVSKQEHPHRPP